MATVKRPSRPPSYTGPATPDRRLASMFAPRSAKAPATVTRICLLGSYDASGPGLPAFMTALRDALLADRPDVTVDIVRSGHDGEDDGRPEVVCSIGSTAQDSRSAALLMNRYDAVVIHYEAGAYADEEGGQVLDILEWITVPVVCVMHEIHLAPTPRQRFITEKLTTSADAVVVLTETGRRALLDAYQVEPRKLMVIRHGRLPEAGEPPSDAAPTAPTILTWGRLHAAKGISVGIDALAQMSTSSPAPRYVVAGPVENAYQESLARHAETLGVADRFEFAAGYIPVHHLATLVGAADLVLLPYADNDRTASSVLAEAVGAGKPVVSTPFPHARELLGDSRSGLLTPYADPQAMATAVTRILNDPELRTGMALHNATAAGAQTWADAASQYRQLINALFRRPPTATR